MAVSPHSPPRAIQTWFTDLGIEVIRIAKATIVRDLPTAIGSAVDALDRKAATPIGAGPNPNRQDGFRSSEPMNDKDRRRMKDSRWEPGQAV